MSDLELVHRVSSNTPELGDRHLELLLARALGVVGRGATALVNRQLLFPGRKLSREVYDALVKVLLGGRGDDERLAGLLVVRRLHTASQYIIGSSTFDREVYEFVDAVLEGPALELLPERELAAGVRLMCEALLDLGAVRDGQVSAGLAGLEGEERTSESRAG